MQAVAAGGLHTMIITQPRSSAERRVVYAMGRGTDGQLGAGVEAMEAAKSENPEVWRKRALEAEKKLECKSVREGNTGAAAAWVAQRFA